MIIHCVLQAIPFYLQLKNQCKYSKVTQIVKNTSRLTKSHPLVHREEFSPMTFGPQDKGSVRIRTIIPDRPPQEKLPVMISPNLIGWGATVIRRGYISAGYAGNDAMDDAAVLKDAYRPQTNWRCRNRTITGV